MAGTNRADAHTAETRIDAVRVLLLMAQSLQKQHPDVVKVVRKWGRWQHQVDYSAFKKNKLLRKPGVEIPEGVNNYGMWLAHPGNA